MRAPRLKLVRFPRGGVMECSRQIATTKPKDVTSDDVGHAHRWTARMLESSRKATAYAPVNRRRFSSGSRDLNLNHGVHL